MRRGAGQQPARGDASAQRLAAFAYPRYDLFFIGQAATNAGSWMQILATNWLVLQLTNSPAALGLNSALSAIPILFLSLVGGVIADRLDRYWLMLNGQVVQLVPDMALAVMVATGHVRVEYIFVYSFVSAMISGLTQPARQAYVPSLVPPKALLSAIALNSILWQGAAVAGPSMAGLVLAKWGLAANFYFNAASDVVNLVALLLIRLPSPPQRREQSPWQSLADGAKYAWNVRDIRIVLVAVAVLSVLGRSYQQLLPVFARNVFHVGPQGFGWMLTAPAAGTIIAGFALGYFSDLPVARWFRVMSVALGLSLLAFAGSPIFWLALVILIVVGATSSASTTLANTLIQQIVDDRYRGRVMSFFMACTWGFQRLGGLPAGLLAQYWGAQVSIFICASSMVVLLAVISRNIGRAAVAEPLAASAD